MTAIAHDIPAGLRDGFAACRAITRERARNFYYGLRLTPEPRRSALFAVYAWSRLGDDIADGPEPSAARRRLLDDFARRTEQAIAATIDDAPVESADPVWPALADTLARYPIDPAWLRQMIEGFRHDIDFAQPDAAADLHLYCDRVAGTVGRMCVAIWGPAPARRERGGAHPADGALSLASVRGRAFQLTNILRDFAEDHAQGRVYLDRQRLDAARLTAADLLAWRDRSACEPLARAVIDEAKAAFADSARLESLIDPACRPVLSAMTRIYRAILARIDADPAIITRPGAARIGPLAKLRIATRAVIDSRLPRAR